MYVHGAWNAICDRCGRKFKNFQLKKTWDGYYVCPNDWEPRHPQDFLRGKPDNQTVPWARPEQEWNFVVPENVILDTKGVGIRGTDGEYITSTED